MIRMTLHRARFGWHYRVAWCTETSWALSASCALRGVVSRREKNWRWAPTRKLAVLHARLIARAYRRREAAEKRARDLVAATRQEIDLG